MRLRATGLERGQSPEAQDLQDREVRRRQQRRPRKRPQGGRRQTRSSVLGADVTLEEGVATGSHATDR